MEAKPVVFSGLTKAATPYDSNDLVFQIRCACGATIAGQRRASHQVVRCAACGRTRFVLPQRVLGPPAISGSPTQAPRSLTRARRAALWVGIALVMFVAVVGGSLRIAGLLVKSRHESPAIQRSTEDLFQAHVNAGNEALKLGAFQTADQELTAALALANNRELRQLQREAAIAADLLSESPAEVARNSIGLPDHEWQELFRKRYAGRSFILDDLIDRDAAGRIVQGHRFRVGGAEARVDFDQLELFKQVPFAAPARALFGIRLAGVRREVNGSWTIVPAPDSGVLVTDPRIVTGLSLRLDGDMKNVLERQKVWLHSLD